MLSKSRVVLWVQKFDALPTGIRYDTIRTASVLNGKHSLLYFRQWFVKRFSLEMLVNKGQGCSTSEYKYVGSCRQCNVWWNELGFPFYFVAECPKGHPYYIGDVSDAFYCHSVTSVKQDLYRSHQLYKSVLKSNLQFLFLLTMFYQVPLVLVVFVETGFHTRQLSISHAP